MQGKRKVFILSHKLTCYRINEAAFDIDVVIYVQL